MFYLFAQKAPPIDAQFKRPMTTLLDLARSNQYDYTNYHHFFVVFIKLLDLSRYKLSWSEFAFYLSKACLDVTNKQSVSHNWSLGSLVCIKQQLDLLSDSELTQLANYFLSHHYINLATALDRQKAEQAENRDGLRASILSGMIHGFSELLGEQLQHRRLPINTLRQEPANNAKLSDAVTKKLLTSPDLSRLNDRELESGLLRVRELFC